MKSLNPKSNPGLYEVFWRFQDSEEKHSGTARWTGKIWIAADTPGGAVILGFKPKPIGP